MMPTESPQTGGLEHVTTSIDSLLVLQSGTDRDAQLSSFVAARLKNLESSATPKRVISVSTEPVRGFIRPDTEIKPTEFVDGFRLDDPDMYTNLMREIAAIKDMPGWQRNSVRDIAPTAVLRTIATYFGSVIGDAETGPRRHAFYADRTTSDSDPCSISELKGTALAECIERASMAQNLLTFLGYDTTLVISSDCELTPGARELHAYNMVRTDKSAFIADFTNPRIVEDMEGHMVNFLPSAYPLSDEQASTILQGGKVTVNHSDVTLTGGEYVMQPAVPRTYGGPSR